MSTRKRRSKVRPFGAFIIIVGALVVVAAGLILGMVSSQLKAEHIAATGMPHESQVDTTGKAGPDLFNAHVPAGMNRGNSADAMALSNTPDSVMNGSFLRALFSIAAVALGVAALVMGMGVMFAVTGIGPKKGSHSRRARAEADPPFGHSKLGA
jgi:ABC-type glycerol-3-phosphate transport system permease component